MNQSQFKTFNRQLFNQRSSDTTVAKSATLIGRMTLLSLAFTLVSCDDLELKSNQDPVEVGVEVEQTRPLVAGTSVGSANLQVQSIPPETLEPENNITTDQVIVVDKDDITQEQVQSAQNNPNVSNSQSENPLASPVESNRTGKSIVVSRLGKIKAGTPEATLVTVMNTLYYGEAKDVAPYYESNMPDLLANIVDTQPAFQQNVQQIIIERVVYNQDKTRAKVLGLVKLTDNDEPEPAEYTLQKFDGQWKVLG